MITKTHIKLSEDYLKLVNSSEYLEAQAKFDKLHKTIKIEQEALKKLVYELKNDKNKFYKKDISIIKDEIEIEQKPTIKIEIIDNKINELNITFQNLNFRR